MKCASCMMLFGVGPLLLVGMGCSGWNVDDESFSSQLDGELWRGWVDHCDLPLDPAEGVDSEQVSFYPRFVLSPTTCLELDLDGLTQSEDSEQIFCVPLVDSWCNDTGCALSTGWAEFAAEDVEGGSDVPGVEQIAVKVAVGGEASPYPTPYRVEAVSQQSPPGVPVPDHMRGLALSEEGECLSFIAFPQSSD